MIVAIEGMDGVGKTTISKMLCSKLGYKYLKEPLKELFKIKSINKISDKVFKEFSNNFIALYLSLGDNYILEKYKNKNVIIDRHVLLNYFWNGNADNIKLFNTLKELFGTPNLTILLKASIEERRKRLMKRNKDDADLSNDVKMSYGYDKMESYLKILNYNYVTIDTDNCSIEEVYEKCLKEINKL